MSLNDEEVSEAWELLRARNRMNQMETKGTFSVGDRVEFNGKHGERIAGLIIKIMRKNIKVQAIEGSSSVWTVSPTFLRKVVE